MPGGEQGALLPLNPSQQSIRSEQELWTQKALGEMCFFWVAIWDPCYPVGFPGLGNSSGNFEAHTLGRHVQLTQNAEPH